MLNEREYLLGYNTLLLYLKPKDLFVLCQMLYECLEGKRDNEESL